jgi:hypothetical protein
MIAVLILSIVILVKVDKKKEHYNVPLRSPMKDPNECVRNCMDSDAASPSDYAALANCVQKCK